MKMFKRFAAALLAGVMVLAMLTACGDSPLKEGAFRVGKASGSGAKLPVSPEPPSLREVANPQGLTEGVCPAPPGGNSEWFLCQTVSFCGTIKTYSDVNRKGRFHAAV